MAGTYYILHVDGAGEYMMRNESGERCLFVFSKKQTVSDFIERMELPEHKEFTAIPFDADSLACFLREARPQMVAIDPISKYDFSPVGTNDFLGGLAKA